jgi:hypothetical protein
MGVDILFLHPPRRLGKDYLHPFLSFPFISNGMLSIADICEKNGISTKIVSIPLQKYYNHNWSLEKFISKVDCKIVVINLHWFVHSYGAIEIAKICKEINPNIKVVLGGLTASLFEKEIINNFHFIDAIVRGDGERPLLIYYKSLRTRRGNYRDIPNITIRLKDRIIRNRIRYIVSEKEFNSQNFTRLNLILNWKNYIKFTEKFSPFNFPLQRGCKFNCPHCGGSRESYFIISERKKTVYLKPENVLSQLKILRNEYNMKNIHLSIGRYKYEKELVKLLLKDKINMKLHFGLHVSDINNQSIELYKKFGDKVKLICWFHNPSTFNYASKKIGIIGKSNLDSYLFIPLGFPSDKRYDLIRRIGLSRYSACFPKLSIFYLPIILEPGSPAYLHPQKYRIKVKLNSFLDFYNMFKKKIYIEPMEPYGYDGCFLSETQVRFWVYLAKCATFINNIHKITKWKNFLKKMFFK